MRRSAQTKLVLDETQWHNIFQFAGIAFEMTDAEGCWLEVNPTFEKMMGYSRAKLYRRSTLEITHPDDRPASIQNMRDLMAGRVESVRTEKRYLHKDGRIVWVDISITPVCRAGQVVGLVGVGFDITEHKTNGAALTQNEEWDRALIANRDEGIGIVDAEEKFIFANPAAYRLLADASSDVIWTCGLDFKLTYISPAVTHLTGFSPAEAQTRTLAQAFAPASLERARTMFAKALIQARNKSIGEIAVWSDVAELEMNCIDGSTVWTETRINFLPDAQGKPQAILGSTRDISERKHAEAEREAQRRTHELAVLYEKTRDLGTYHDMPLLLQMLATRVTELLMVPDCAIFLFDAARNEFELSAARGISMKPGARVSLANMSGLGASIVVSPIAPADPFCLPEHPDQMRATLKYSDYLLGVLIVGASTPTVRAFTEADTHLLSLFAEHAAAAIYNVRMFESVRISRERAQSLSHQLLEAQETERRAIACELHDEIGQAITSVQLNLQTLAAIADSESQDTLEETMHTVEQILEQVRDLSRALRPSMLDDFGLAPALKWYLERQAKRAGFQAEFHADSIEKRLPEELETVCFRVAQEALTNIVRHARAEHVTIELREQPSQLALTITDDGQGFEPAEAFQRASGGNSFGLLGMRERVMLIGGDMAIQSAPQQGTQIRVQIPLVAPAIFLERRKHKRGTHAAN